MATLRALAIIRVSPRPRGWDGESPEFQRADIETWCTENDVEIVEWATDILVSGGDPDRPSRLRALELAEQKAIDVVVVRSLDRFSREDALLHVGDVASLKRHDVDVIYTAETDLDHNSDAYPFLLLLKSQAAAASRLKLKVDTRRGMRSSKERGTYFGPAPWGWRKVGFRTSVPKAPHEQSGITPDVGGTWEEVAELYRLRDEGSTMRSLAATFGRTIASLRYTLRMELHKSKDPGDGLIPADRWERVNAKWQPRVTHQGARAYIAAGIVICGECGKRMAGRSTWGGPRDPALRPTYTCDTPEVPHARRNINQGAVIEVISEALAKAYLPPVVAERVASRLSGPSSRVVQEKRGKALAALAREDKAVKDAQQAGLLTLPEALERAAGIKARRDALPPEPLAVKKVRESIKLLNSLSALFARAITSVGKGTPEADRTVRQMNGVLRKVLQVHRRPDERDGFYAKWLPPYEAILGVAAERPHLELVPDEGEATG